MVLEQGSLLSFGSEVAAALAPSHADTGLLPAFCPMLSPTPAFEQSGGKERLCSAIYRTCTNFHLIALLRSATAIAGSAGGVKARMRRDGSHRIATSCLRTFTYHSLPQGSSSSLDDAQH
jgi:hypothetical protein